MKKTLLTHEEWAHLMLGMPFKMGGARTKEEAMTVLACCLKSKARRAGSFREDYGQLLEYGSKVVVVSRFDRPEAHPDKSHAKWTGSRFEYEDMWDCD